MNETLYMILFYFFFVLVLIVIVSLVILLIGIFRWGVKKRNFPTKRLLVFLVLLGISSVQFYNQYYNLNYLPAGELNAVFPSPNKTHTISLEYMV
ncbi:hypothetical protein CWR45_18400 [Oceanobacillus chungangensis]|uniref:Uncharacterized protein n=1 Tax=Oceanobacillus chungangensis TaxID=1229152 RepID=A0A3D8PIT9_9BACI|nr:hypothetical protein CWR45_18400 [Oceanobacillus chungangensis]